MVSTATGRVMLLPIHPQYAEAILAGTKTVEFRRRVVPDDVTDVVMYATAPMQRIVGAFEIARVVTATPAQAWHRFRNAGGIGQAAFDSYFAGAEQAFVIEIHNPRWFSSSFGLSDVDEDLRPPQSYQYLKDHQLRRTRQLAARGAGLPAGD